MNRALSVDPFLFWYLFTRKLCFPSLNADPDTCLHPEGFDQVIGAHLLKVTGPVRVRGFRVPINSSTPSTGTFHGLQTTKAVRHCLLQSQSWGNSTNAWSDVASIISTCCWSLGSRLLRIVLF